MGSTTEEDSAVEEVVSLVTSEEVDSTTEEEGSTTEEEGSNTEEDSAVEEADSLEDSTNDVGWISEDVGTPVAEDSKVVEAVTESVLGMADDSDETPPEVVADSTMLDSSVRVIQSSSFIPSRAQMIGVRVLDTAEVSDTDPELRDSVMAAEDDKVDITELDSGIEAVEDCSSSEAVELVDTSVIEDDKNVVVMEPNSVFESDVKVSTVDVPADDSDV